MLNNPHVKAGLAALAAYALVAFIQKSVIQVPLFGKYLPGGL